MMPQPLPAVALALVCTVLLTCTLLAERLWSSAQLNVPPNGTPKPAGWQAGSRSLGVDTVAEGMETEEEALLLQKLGCKNGQGCLFGRPVRAAELQQRIALAVDQVQPLDSQKMVDVPL